MEFSAIINYKSKIANILIIIFAIIIGYKIYRNQDKVVELLKQEKELEIRKNVSLDSISGLEKKINFYKGLVNKKDIASAVNTLSSISNASQVKIVSLKPLQEKDYLIYTKYPFRIEVTAKDYHVIGKFVSELENSPDIYIIESALIKPAAKAESARPAAEFKDSLMLELTVSTILFK